MNNNKRSKVSTVPSTRPIRVGFIGLCGTKGWAVKTHFIAIQQLSSQFEIRALLNSSIESSMATINKLKLRHARAFDSVKSFAECTDIDMIVVSVRVPEHYRLIKDVLIYSEKNHNLRYLYVEWCLASNLEQAEEIYELSQQRPTIQTIICLQGRKSPYVVRAKELVSEGSIGEINSIEVFGNGGWYGYERPIKSPCYLYEIESGVNLVSTSFGHTIDVLQYIAGSYFKKINAMLSNNISLQYLVDESGKRTGEVVSKTCPDHLLFHGVLEKGAIPVSCSFKGGTPAKKFTKNLVIDIHGTKGDLKIEGDAGFVEISNLVLYFCGRRSPIGNSPPPVDEGETMEVFHLRNYNSVVGNILRIYESIADFHFKGKAGFTYSRDPDNLLLSNGFTKQGFRFEGFPTFRDAIVLHRLIDSVFRSDHEMRTIDVSNLYL